MANPQVEKVEYEGLVIHVSPCVHGKMGAGFAVEITKDGKKLGGSGYAGPNRDRAVFEGEKIIDAMYNAPYDL